MRACQTALTGVVTFFTFKGFLLLEHGIDARGTLIPYFVYFSSCTCII